MLNILLLYDLTISLLGMYPAEIVQCLYKYLHRNVLSSFICNCPNLEKKEKNKNSLIGYDIIEFSCYGLSTMLYDKTLVFFLSLNLNNYLDQKFNGLQMVFYIVIMWCIEL